MSGGSYDYLYCKETYRLFDPMYTSYIEDMADRCLELGCEDVARDLQRLYQYIKSAQIRVDVLREQLKDVMRSVEWYDSGDFGKDNFMEHIERYRNGGAEDD